MVNRRAALGTLTEALARRGDECVEVSRLGIALHGDAPPLSNELVDPVQLAALEPDPHAVLAASSESDDVTPPCGIDAEQRLSLVAERLVERHAAAQMAIDRLRSELRTEDAIIAIAEVAHTLAKVRRSLRALAAEVAEVEAEGRAVLVLAAKAQPGRSR